MDKKQEAFLLELLNDFKIEAAEHHQAIVNGLIDLEKNHDPSVGKLLIETTFREIHSMKGASRAVNQIEIERLCQSMESIFHQAKQGLLNITSQHFDTLHQATDILGVLLNEVETKEKSIGANVLSLMMKRLEKLASGQVPKQPMDFPVPTPVPIKKQIIPDAIIPSDPVKKSGQPPTVPEVGVNDDFHVAEKPVSKDTVRIATSKLSTLLREAEEFISVKATLGYYIREIQKLQGLGNSPIVREMDQFHRSLSRMIDDLLLDIKTTLLYPFSMLLDIIPKIVRDLGKEYGKEINLTIQGGEIEIDRRILEDLKDPLIHLIRNSIDHGIESPKIRREAGKSPTGILEINIMQESGRQVILVIRDDGAGIDREKVLSAAIKLGVIQRDVAEKMTDSEVFALIFRSGISTSPFITDISGRGLGMAIVAEKVTNSGGTISISSVPGKGTTFTINLPVTISNFRGILVQVNDHHFIVPTSFVERAVRIRSQDIRTVESRQIIILNDESIGLVRLGDVLGISPKPQKKSDDKPMPVLILSVAQRRIGLIVEQVHGEQEGMVKDMGPQLLHVRNISGVTILGNGQIIPILNIPEFLETASQAPAMHLIPETDGEIAGTGNHHRYILVAEDSITLRSLLKNIIESAGYRVKTAVDGMEAFEFIKNEVFDLVVSDVEMPRLNGFDLTARIKSDKQIAETPVILVTALDSPDDRQRGMECGANAYIVKGSFEQSNLLETIHRLI